MTLLSSRVPYDSDEDKAYRFGGYKESGSLAGNASKSGEPESEGTAGDEK